MLGTLPPTRFQNHQRQKTVNQLTEFFQMYGVKTDDTSCRNGH